VACLFLADREATIRKAQALQLGNVLFRRSLLPTIAAFRFPD
jgi:hypothetical protein